LLSGEKGGTAETVNIILVVIDELEKLLTKESCLKNIINIKAVLLND